MHCNKCYETPDSIHLPRLIVQTRDSASVLVKGSKLGSPGKHRHVLPAPPLPTWSTALIYFVQIFVLCVASKISSSTTTSETSTLCLTRAGTGATKKGINKKVNAWFHWACSWVQMEHHVQRPRDSKNPGVFTKLKASQSCSRMRRGPATGAPRDRAESLPSS